MSSPNVVSSPNHRIRNAVGVVVVGLGVVAAACASSGEHSTPPTTKLAPASVTFKLSPDTTPRDFFCEVVNTPSGRFAAEKTPHTQTYGQVLEGVVAHQFLHTDTPTKKQLASAAFQGCLRDVEVVIDKYNIQHPSLETVLPAGSVVQEPLEIAQQVYDSPPPAPAQ